jgi:hypothetical protein
MTKRVGKKLQMPTDISRNTLRIFQFLLQDSPTGTPRRFCRATFTAPSGPEGNDAQNQPKKAGEKFGIGNTSSERVSLPVLDGRFLLKKMVGILTLSGMDILSFFS